VTIFVSKASISRGSNLEQDQLGLGKSLKLPGEGRGEAVDSGQREPQNPPLR
jgi:hypothetical protein